MPESFASPQWRITTSMFIEGCAYGSRYPSLIFNLQGVALNGEQRASLQQWLDTVIPPHRADWPLAPARPAHNDWENTLQDLLRTVQRLQHATAQAVFEQGNIQGMVGTTARCQVPTRVRAASALLRSVQLLLRCMDSWASGKGDSSGELAAALQAAMEELRGLNPTGANTPSFIKAAIGLKMPFQETPSLVHYGTGKRSCWMDSSHTGYTSHLGVQVARNKVIAADMLQRSGLPVPEHQLATDAAQAVVAANALGYPVVVKPVDRNGGAGVAANLLNDDEVRQAFDHARQFSPNIMVEKYVEGRDYRLLVFRGEMIWAIERVPGVVGDGQHSVAELVDQLNADPRRGDSKQFPLRRLPLDAEAEQMLERQQLDAGFVPDKGQMVRLRRTANVSAGGTPVAVNERVHPDNSLLAERAAQACRLDIAGIDLLISDISRSWKEVGATIIEVNNQPALGQTTTHHLYAPVLSQLVPGDGRVPVVAVLGAPAQSNLVEVLGKAISSRLQTVVGYHDARVVSVNDQVLKSAPVSTHDAAQMLMLTPTVGAMVLSINDLSLLQTGLPFPHFDVLVLAGNHIDPGVHADLQQALPALMRAVVSSCDGTVVTVKEAQLQINRPAEPAGPVWLDEPVPAGQLVNTLVDLVAETESRHSQEPVFEAGLTARRH